MNTLRRPFGRPAALVLALVLFAFFLLLDLREGGPSSSLSTWHIVTPGHYAHLFGVWFVIGAIGLDVALAVATTWCLSFAVDAWRRRRAVGPTCTPGAVMVLGVAVFGCPGCILPLAGTLGVSLLAINLPLYGLEFKIVALALVLGTGLLWHRRLSRPVEPVSAALLRAEVRP